MVTAWASLAVLIGLFVWHGSFLSAAKDLMVPKVTAGPISASTKVYSAPDGHPDIRVPFREIALSPAAGERAFRVYDPSGPYTDASAEIDVDWTS